MRKRYAVVVTSLSLALAACGSQVSQPNQGVPNQGVSAQSGSGSYLIGFKRGAGLQRAAVARAGGKITQEWPQIEAVAARLPEGALNGLRHNPNVEYVEADLLRYALGQRHIGATGRPAPTPTPAPGNTSNTAVLWAPSGELTWGDQALKVGTLRASGYSGAGTAVCVGDTGIDATHPEFQHKLSGFKNFMGDGRDDPYALNDLSHHGTHVSGTIFAQYGAGTGASGLQSGMDPNGVGGVASGIHLYMARVLGDDGSGSSSGIINGINWCAAQLQSQGGSEAHVVISLSLGSSQGSKTEQRAYDNVYAKGALIVAASGNDGAAIGYPANYGSVVAVGAIDDKGNLASFSNFGANQELVAPGVSVLSSVPLGAGLAARASAANVPTYSSVLAADFAARGTVSNTAIVAAGGTNELCGAGTTNPALNGKIALIARGTCSFEEKANNAVASGAVAAIVYNNVAGDLGMTLTNQKSIPVVGIPQADGQATLAKLPTTGNVAIGGADYEYFDGTSMATPHASAAAAVVWAAKPNLTNAQLRSLLQTSASDLGAAGKDATFGYGLVNPNKAITGQ